MTAVPRPQGVLPAVAPVIATGVPRPGIVVTGGAVALIAALVLGGWWAGLAAPASVVPGWRVMVPGTAFGFVCVGLGLMVFASGYDAAGRWLLPALAAAAAILPIATLGEYATGERWGLETWLGVDFPNGGAYAGRQSPVTALSFVFLTVSLAALPWAAASLGRRAAARRRDDAGDELAGRAGPLVRRLAAGRRARPFRAWRC